MYCHYIHVHVGWCPLCRVSFMRGSTVCVYLQCVYPIFVSISLLFVLTAEAVSEEQVV